jgi:hypothetical protein
MLSRMHVEPVGTVLERIILADRLAGQLAILADQQNAGAEPLGERRRDDEAARLDSGDEVGLPLDAEGDPLDRCGESGRVEQEPRRAGGW